MGAGHPVAATHALPCLGGGEQKWSKGKSRDINANKVQFEEELYTRFMAEVPKVTNWGGLLLSSCCCGTASFRLGAALLRSGWTACGKRTETGTAVARGLASVVSRELLCRCCQHPADPCTH